MKHLDYSWGIAFALFGSLNNAFVFVTCRKLGKDIHQSIHPFFYALTTIIGGFIALSFKNDDIFRLTKTDYVLLFLCGVFMWIKEEGQSLALKYEKGGRTAAINYLVVFNSFLFDALLYGETIRGTDVAGAVCIVIFTVSNAFMKCFGKT